MDIHRCRFVPYPPSTINALAFSQSTVSRKQNADHVRLAIGRANGDIEIWNPLGGAWLQETILRGGKDRSVDGLVWIQDPDQEDESGTYRGGRLRLFSIGYTTTVTEWDLENGKPLRQSSGNHGEIWCLAAQPSPPETAMPATGSSALPLWHSQMLVTGCTDGAVVLYSTADQDLSLERVLVRPSAKRAKVISITFQDRNIVVAGCTDSTIRIYDIRNATLVRSISLGAGISGGPKEIIVWAVKCLRNGNIVSGDSTGEVRIWDGKTYTLVQRLQSHKQDVLSLAVSWLGDTILSGGMDRRTVIYKQTEGPRSRWAKVTHQRFHSHDVKTMATFEGNGLSIVASGGPDASPMIVPLRKFGMEHQRMLPRLPQEPAVQSAPAKRLLMSWWDREIHIWHVNKSSKDQFGSPEPEVENEASGYSHSRKLIAKICIKGEANITSASLSLDGSILAVSTVAEIKVFELKSYVANDGNSMRVSKIRVPHKLSSSGAKLLQFSPDGKWLGIIRNDNHIIAVRVLGTDTETTQSLRLLASPSKLARIDRKVEKQTLLGAVGSYDRTITRMAFSADSRILAVGDLAGYIDTWVLEGQLDTSHMVENTEEDSVGNDAVSVSSSSSDEAEIDEEKEKKPKRILGQRWIQNPSTSLLPKLSAAPVILSFRPASATSRKSQPGSSLIIPHATRRNPHPQLHDLSLGENRLLVVTATSKVHEFDVLKGGFTQWSRSNPTAKFPAQFQLLRDQAMGCLWDVEQERERLWLYGSNWTWMFDLSRNFPTQEEQKLTNGHKDGALALLPLTNSTQPSKKRKRGRGTGAGSRVPDSELAIGMSRKTQTVVFEGDIVTQQVYDLDSRQDASDVDFDDSDDDEALERFQRGEDVATLPNENGTTVEGRDDSDGPPHWWHSYKYRPIMGIVPLMCDEKDGIEVALVERPIWETDLPPRYYGDQEWDRAGV